MPSRCSRAFLWTLLLAIVLSAQTTLAEPNRFVEKRIDGAWLAYVNELPVLSIGGTPGEMGSQLASLVGPATQKLVDYPRQTFARDGGNEAWTKLLAASRALWPNIPPNHREEIDTLVRLAKVDRDALMAGNVMMDIYRGMGCSSLLVESSRSATGGPVFGRNLDFFSKGYLHNYTLVMVYRPRGKHAFASVGFAGLFGCLSGMNDAGLTLAIHEVLAARDGSRLFNPEGVPYTFAFRRVLEECATVGEAESLMKSIKRTTMYSLALCDRQRAIVLEITPKSVVRREAVAGLCPCTNHFRTPELAVFPFCNRFDALLENHVEQFSVEEVERRMHAANMGRLTLQTMVFEPVPLRLHLAFGKLPASAGPFHQLDLKSLFSADSKRPE